MFLVSKCREKIGAQYLSDRFLILLNIPRIEVLKDKTPTILHWKNRKMQFWKILPNGFQKFFQIYNNRTFLHRMTYPTENLNTEPFFLPYFARMCGAPLELRY